MSGRATGKIYNEIKKQKEELLDNYLTLMASKFNCDTIQDVFKQGYPIIDLERFNDEVSKEVWGDKLPETNWKFNCRVICEDVLTKMYGNYKLYFNTPEFIKRKTSKIENTNLKLYGWKNPGQSDEHKNAMKKGPKCTNPFSTLDFKYKEYIKGKTVLPDDQQEYNLYRLKVERLTAINKNKLEFTGKCYYTGIDIFKFDGNKTVNRNDYNLATVDHKISVLAGFIRGLSPEVVSDIGNLCWCSKYFNSLKKEKCEDEIKLSGMIERFKRVMEILNENKENYKIEE